MLTIDGLASGFDTTAIIEGLLAIQEQRISQLTTRQRDIRTEQTAFAGIEARLLGLRGTLSNLAKSQSNALAGRIATSSDESVLVANATNRAAVGTYSLTVNKLAQRHQVASNNFNSVADEITQGELTINAGGTSPVTVTIDGSNNSVQGLVDAVNAADTGVTASILQLGTAGSTSYRILLSSDKSGFDHQISLTNNLAPSAGDAVQPVFDFGDPVQSAQDAEVALGNITIKSETNDFDNLIPGVSIDLIAADPNKSINLTVSHDVEGATEAIDEFVQAYNDLLDFVNEQTRFNPDTNIASPLLGNRSLINIQDVLQTTLTSSIAGLPNSANRLSSLGITIESDTRLSFNSGRIQEILNGADPDVSAEDLQRIFALGGTSTNSGIRFIVGSTKTQSGAVEIDITDAAQQARLAAASPLSASTVIDGTNNQLVISLDGSDDVTVTLQDGTYDRAALAMEVQRAINTRAEFARTPLSATISADTLVLTSAAYGSAAEITVRSGTGVNDLGFTNGATDKGQDVVGKFLVDGVEETATGRGQVLTGDSENENTADLQVRITLTSSQLVAGNETTLTVTRGFAAALDLKLDGFLDPVDGRVKSINDTYDDQVENIQESIDRLNAQFEARRESLVQQFVRLETTLSEFQTLGSYLAQQLGGLSLLAG